VSGGVVRALAVVRAGGVPIEILLG
jgi:hypothetical protein